MGTASWAPMNIPPVSASNTTYGLDQHMDRSIGFDGWWFGRGSIGESVKFSTATSGAGEDQIGSIGKRERTMSLALLRGIVNHSYGKLQRNSDWNESLINSEWNESLIEHKRLRDTNRYEVLEKYDEVENEVEIGTKYNLNKIVRVKNNLIKTVNQPLCELSNIRILPLISLLSSIFGLLITWS